MVTDDTDDDADGRIEHNAAAFVIADEHFQVVVNRIRAGSADHCLRELRALETQRENPREPVMAAVRERLEQLNGP